MIVWLNGELVEDAQVSVMDHGLTVGDGVFETLIVRQGFPFAKRRHLDRLERSAAGLGLRGCPRDQLELAMDEIVAATGTEDGRLRLTVTGGIGPAGSGRGDGPCTILATVGPLSVLPPTAAVITVRWTRNENSALAGLKTTSYGENVVALARAKDADADEAIFANTKGELCEGTGTNIAVVIDGELVTPPLSSGCLAGITRALAIEHCGVVERTLPYSVLGEVDEAVLLGTTRDVQPISSVDGRALHTTDISRAAQAAFTALVARDLDP